jgi:hypothetical protein
VEHHENITTHSPFSLIFRWLAIPWIQEEINAWALLRNQTAPRKDKHKVLPHGIPELIRLHPEDYGSLDFKVSDIVKEVCSVINY